jgi:hypothetical protein
VQSSVGNAADVVIRHIQDNQLEEPIERPRTHIAYVVVRQI